MKALSQERLTGTIAGLVAAAAIGAACTFGTADQAYAVSAAEKAAEAQDALAQLSAMQLTLDDASQRYFASLSEYQAAVEQRDAAQARVNELTEEISDIQGRLGSRAREMYRQGASTVMDLLLGATSFDEFTKNWDLLNRMNESDASLSIKTQELRAESEEQKAEYGRQADIADEKSREAGAAFEEAEALVEQMQITYESLSAEAQELYAAEQAAAYAAAQAQAAAQAAAAQQQATNTDYVAYGGGGQTYAQSTGGGTTSTTTAAAGAVTTTVDSSGNAIVDRARSQIGSDYVWGGVGGSDGGYDCSGFVSYALTGSNTRLGTTLDFMKWNEVSTPSVGDVAVNEGHTGIVSRIDSDGTVYMVHAINESKGVQETAVSPYGDYKYVTP